MIIFPPHPRLRGACFHPHILLPVIFFTIYCHCFPAAISSSQHAYFLVPLFISVFCLWFANLFIFYLYFFLLLFYTYELFVAFPLYSPTNHLFCPAPLVLHSLIHTLSFVYSSSVGSLYSLHSSILLYFPDLLLIIL